MPYGAMGWPAYGSWYACAATAPEGFSPHRRQVSHLDQPSAHALPPAQYIGPDIDFHTGRITNAFPPSCLITACIMHNAIWLKTTYHPPAHQLVPAASAGSIPPAAAAAARTWAAPEEAVGTRSAGQGAVAPSWAAPAQALCFATLSRRLVTTSLYSFQNRRKRRASQRSLVSARVVGRVPDIAALCARCVAAEPLEPDHDDGSAQLKFVGCEPCNIHGSRNLLAWARSHHQKTRCPPPPRLQRSSFNDQ